MLRIGWWALNDVERDPPERPVEWTDNLARLADMMGKASEDRLVLAEIAREQGQFAEATRLLKGRIHKELKGRAKALQVLVDKGSRRVEALDPEIVQGPIVLQF